MSYSTHYRSTQRWVIRGNHHTGTDNQKQSTWLASPRSEA